MERRRISLRFFLLLAVLVSCLAAPAAADRWEPLRLWGGDVQLAAAAVDPSVVYAVTPAAGIFRSADRGATWQFTGYPPDRLEARDLFIDPHDERRLFAIVYAPVASSYVGLFRSEDGGQSWRRVAIGGNLLYVYEVAFDPETRGVAYAATSRGLFRSRNGGGAWERIALAGVPLATVAVAPANPNVLLVSTGQGADSGLFRSTDGGQSFSRVFAEGQDGFVFDPTRPRRVYGFNFGGLAVSDDLGATWTREPSVSSILALAVAPSGALLKGGYEFGVRRSLDEGATWIPGPQEEIRRPADRVDSLVVLGNRVLAGGARGVWRSDSEGRGWQASSTGIRAQQTTVLEVAGDADSTVWAGTWAGFFQSQDGGESFQGRNGLGPTAFLEVLALHPRQPEIAYAWGCCAENEDGVRVGGLLKTEDGGASWEPLPYTGVDREFILVEVDPVDPDIVYAGGLIEPHGSPCTALRSTDGGANWSCMIPLGGRDFTSLAIDPRNPQNLFAVSSEELYRSTDRGATWTKVPTRTRGLRNLAVDPSRSQRLYAIYGNSLLRSDNGGRTWTAKLAALPGGQMWDLLLDPARPGRIWATAEFFEIGTYKSTSRVFRSDDFGEHWTELSAGLRAGTVIVELAGDPLSADVIYAGSAGQGLFRLEIVD